MFFIETIKSYRDYLKNCKEFQSWTDDDSSKLKWWKSTWIYKIWDFLDFVRIHNVDFLKDSYREIKYAFQRVKYGSWISDKRASWNIDWSTIKFYKYCLSLYRKNLQSQPGSLYRIFPMECSNVLKELNLNYDFSKEEDQSRYEKEYSTFTNEQNNLIFNKFQKIWEDYLDHLLFLLNEADEETCSMRNDIPYKHTFYFEKITDENSKGYGCYEMKDHADDPGNEEIKKTNDAHFKKEFEIRQYQEKSLKNFLVELSTIINYLYD